MNILVFKGSIFCGLFYVFDSIEDWKISFCINNGFDELDVHAISLSSEEFHQYQTIMQSPNASRSIYVDNLVKIIGTQLVDNQEVIMASFSPASVN